MSQAHNFNFVQYLRGIATEKPNTFDKYPKLIEFLNSFDNLVVPGVIYRTGSDNLVEKTDGEDYIVYMEGIAPRGWLKAKEAKMEEWSKMLPGATERVWFVPQGNMKVYHPISDTRELFEYLEFKIKTTKPTMYAPTIPVEEVLKLRAHIDEIHDDFSDVEVKVDYTPDWKELPAVQVPTQDGQPLIDDTNLVTPVVEQNLLFPDPKTIEEEILAKELGKPLKKKRLKKENLDGSVLVKKQKKEKAPKTPKVKPDRSLKTLFKAYLSSIDIEKLKKPWMATKAFRLIETEEALQAWADQILADQSRWRLDVEGKLVPVIAVDAETLGLDNRVLVDIDDDGSLIYEVKAEVAGLCLSSDGIEGIYLPINHEQGKCVSREAVQRILQYLFDRAHLIFYNAKFDREILRICLGIVTRDFPHFEDVQVLNYDNDPKADLDDQKSGKTFLSDAGGLKSLSKKMLGMEQIELEDLIRIKALYVSSMDCKCKHSKSEHEGKCTLPGCKCEGFQGKESLRFQFAPFNWLPTNIALWYAGGDAITTWLLWEKVQQPARSRSSIHRIDHQLVDSITWIERQRFLIDTEHHAKTVKWHQAKIRSMEAELRRIANGLGWPERSTDDGKVMEETVFNVNSSTQVARFLFDICKMPKIVYTEAGNASVNAETCAELLKKFPDHPFLTLFDKYKDYISLHPENLRYDPKDHSARVYFRQNVVAGGRLAASGGTFDKDGGFELNPQGIKKPTGNWNVHGNILKPDEIPLDEIEEHQESELHPSCFREKKKAPGIIKNHIGQYLGYAICLVPGCTTCEEKFGILIPDTRIDANEVLNMRILFIAMVGWTFFSIDYSNIEMRCAANCSLEPKFVNEFLHGKGDFHSLTATNVFPEFKNLSKDDSRYKDYRELAKIINFALLYGGTEYTIYENMSKKKPDMTMAIAKEMVEAYWRGVPKFKEFCDQKKREAEYGPAATNEPKWQSDVAYKKDEIVQHDDCVWVCLGSGAEKTPVVNDPPCDRSENWIRYMMCRTNVGRIINFVSAMEAQGIHKPNNAEKENYRQYRKYKDVAKEAEEDGDFVKAEEKNRLAQALWATEATGVRNHIDFSRFVGKIQRVAVNVPLQGLAGDMMRMAVNRIRYFATHQQPAVQSVMRLHATVHDEVDLSIKNEYIPFIIPRLTRLMKLRKLHELKKWPVPIECDVEYGKSWDVEFGIFKDGYTKIKGLENYINPILKDVFDDILAKLESGDAEARAKVEKWLSRELHPHLIKDGFLKKLMDAKDKGIRKTLTITFQLQEYWEVDTISEEDYPKLETLEQYEASHGLTPADRGVMPENGYLGHIPLDAKVHRPGLERLFEAEPAIVPMSDERFLELAKEEDGCMVSAGHFPTDLFTTPAVLKDLTKEEFAQLREALGKGSLSTVVLYGGKEITLKNVAITDIPEQFLVSENAKTVQS
jgi:DNA polymerase I-like protein with 3'-5' exonuclease and polymerase domains